MKKLPILSPKPVTYVLSQLSKAALIDIVYDLVAQRCSNADEPEAAELAHELKAAIAPVLEHRKDRMPAPWNG
jgi:hypothetical protein